MAGTRQSYAETRFPERVFNLVPRFALRQRAEQHPMVMFAAAASMAFMAVAVVPAGMSSPLLVPRPYEREDILPQREVDSPGKPSNRVNLTCEGHANIAGVTKCMVAAVREEIAQA